MMGKKCGKNSTQPEKISDSKKYMYIKVKWIVCFHA